MEVTTRFKGLDLKEWLKNCGWWFGAFKGGCDEDHLQGTEMQKGKMVVSGGLKNSWEEKRKTKEKRKFSSVSQSSPTLCDPMTAACQASLSITNSWSLLKLISVKPKMPSNHLILSSPSPPAFNLSQYQGLFHWVSSLHQVVKGLEFQLQHQSFQWIFRIDFL